MHIVIFVDYHDSTVGGVQTSVRGQRKGLEELGHTVTIVSPPPVGRKETDPHCVTVPATPFRPNGFPMVLPTKRNMKYIQAALDQLGPIDIIHVQTNMGIGMMGVKIARKLSVPLVQTMHGRDDVFAQDTFPLPYITTTFLKFFHQRYVPHTSEVHRLTDNGTAHNAWQIMVSQAQAADCVVMPSHHFKEKFREHGVMRPMEVISNGISDDVVASLPQKLKPTPKRKSPLKVIWCGRLSTEKRPLESIEAVRAIEGASLDLYGNGPLEKTIQEYITANNLGDRIHLKGRVSQSEILAAMWDHDVLLYPSYGFDNQPMVLIEAVAASVPVIYCDPDLTECMPKEGALITDGISVEALTHSLQYLQDTPKARQKMHKAMFDHRNKIVQSYHSKKMITLYKRVIKKYKS